MERPSRSRACNSGGRLLLNTVDVPSAPGGGRLPSRGEVMLRGAE